MSQNQAVVEVPAVEFHAPVAAVGGHAVAPAGGGGAMDIATTRAAQEVQAAMVVAKRFPRDPDMAYARIMAACKRPGLAAQATYAYNRGGSEVSGPSIRLAEEIARNWGNIDTGFVELEQRKGESSVMAYAWDLETNTRITRVFSVSHIRHTKSGQKLLTDPRDIYETVANQASRRVRAAILAVVPGDVVEAAVAQCDQTLQAGQTKPLRDRIRDCLAKFQERGVNKVQIETRIGHSVESMTERELLQMGKIYTAVRDGYSAVEEWFPPEQPAGAGQTPDTQQAAGARGRARARVAGQQAAGPPPTDTQPPPDAVVAPATSEPPPKQPETTAVRTSAAQLCAQCTEPLGDVPTYVTLPDGSGMVAFCCEECAAGYAERNSL